MKIHKAPAGVEPHLRLIPELAAKIVWSDGWCSEPACTDGTCLCGLCRKPIGVPDDDPRWAAHNEFCHECELCIDEVPLMLMGTNRGAQFHTACFRRLIGEPE